MYLYYCHHCDHSYQLPINSPEQYTCTICRSGFVELVAASGNDGGSVAIDAVPTPLQSADFVPASEASGDGQAGGISFRVDVQMIYSERDGAQGNQFEQAAAQPPAQTSEASVGSVSPLFSYAPNRANESPEEDNNVTSDQAIQTSEEDTNDILDQAALRYDITNVGRPISEYTLSLLNTREATEQEADVEVCVICTDIVIKNDTLTELPCKHKMHQACIMKWLKVDASCPICRASMRDVNEERRLARRRSYYRDTAGTAAGFERSIPELDELPSTSARTTRTRTFAPCRPHNRVIFPHSTRIPTRYNRLDILQFFRAQPRYNRMDAPQSTRTQPSEAETPTSSTHDNASTSSPDDSEKH